MTMVQEVTSQDRGNLLILLKKAQSEFGYVPERIMLEIAKSSNIPLSEVYGVASFYSFLATKQGGRNTIRICRSLPCHLKNSAIIIESVQASLGIKPGETTPDGRFSLEFTNCIGACDNAPAMMINSDVHVNLTPSKIAQILGSYK